MDVKINLKITQKYIQLCNTIDYVKKKVRGTWIVKYIEIIMTNKQEDERARQQQQK